MFYYFRNIELDDLKEISRNFKQVTQRTKRVT